MLDQAVLESTRDVFCDNWIMTTFTVQEWKGDMCFSCVLPETKEVPIGNVKHKGCRNFVSVFHTKIHFSNLRLEMIYCTPVIGPYKNLKHHLPV